MNLQLERRLRNLEKKYAAELVGSRDIRIVWKRASRAGGLGPGNEPEAALDSNEVVDLPAAAEKTIDEEINDNWSAHDQQK